MILVQTLIELSWKIEPSAYEMDETVNVLYVDWLSDYNRIPLNQTVERLYPVPTTKVYSVFIYAKYYPTWNARRDFFRILRGAWIFLTHMVLLMF